MNGKKLGLPKAIFTTENPITNAAPADILLAATKNSQWGQSDEPKLQASLATRKNLESHYKARRDFFAPAMPAFYLHSEKNADSCR
jgi:hypothetical protein